MATSAWQASTAYSAGALVRATVLPGTGLVFKAQNAGTSSSTQPTWPTTIGNTVVDGGVTWVAVSLISGEFQKAAPSAIIELFELQLVAALHGSNDIYRFHAGANATANNSDVVWAGNTYTRFPIEADGFEYSGNGQLPRPKIRVSNIFSTVSAILASVNQTTPGSDLTGAKVTRIRTLARYLDDVNFEGGSNPFGQPDPTAEFPREIYYIDRKSAENRAVVEFELASSLDLAGVRAPKRQCIANVCQWKYRSTECGYTGSNYYDENDQVVGSLALDVCGKRLSSCELRFGANAELPFGSFPGVGAYTT
jgi:lambda family phage minor tail protein L